MIQINTHIYHTIKIILYMYICIYFKQIDSIDRIDLYTHNHIIYYICICMYFYVNIKDLATLWLFQYGCVIYPSSICNVLFPHLQLNLSLPGFPWYLYFLCFCFPGYTLLSEVSELGSTNKIEQKFLSFWYGLPCPVYYFLVL